MSKSLLPSRRGRQGSGLQAIALIANGYIAPAKACAEWEFNLFTGDVFTMAAEVHLERPGGTVLKFSAVAWDSDPLAGAPYYGIRLTRWLDGAPRWGVALEFSHFKLVGELDHQVEVAGTRSGSPVDSTENLRDTFTALDFSNGNNIVLLNVMYRLPVTRKRGSTLWEHAQIQTGVGIGVSVPYVNVIVGSSRTKEYQASGVALQGQAGVSWYAGPHLSVLIQYKLSYSHIDVELEEGGTLQTFPWSHHFNVGVSLHT